MFTYRHKEPVNFLTSYLFTIHFEIYFYNIVILFYKAMQQIQRKDFLFPFPFKSTLLESEFISLVTINL